jgi:hypothetical protein
MTKQNCKHGLIKETCAYCIGKITKATSNDSFKEGGGHNSLTFSDFEHGSVTKAICAMKSGFRLRN